VALAAVADDGNFFRFDQVHIRIAVVIHAHVPLLSGNRPRRSGVQRRPAVLALGYRCNRTTNSISQPDACL
jgi:hypothetical protein